MWGWGIRLKFGIESGRLVSLGLEGRMGATCHVLCVMGLCFHVSVNSTAAWDVMCGVRCVYGLWLMAYVLMGHVFMFYVPEDGLASNPASLRPNRTLISLFEFSLLASNPHNKQLDCSCLYLCSDSPPTRTTNNSIVHAFTFALTRASILLLAYCRF